MAEADVNPGGGGAGAPDGDNPPVSWREDLPEDIRENPHLTRYESKEAAAKGIIEAQEFISRSRPTLPTPKDDAPTEEWDKYYTAQGRPEKPDGYEFAKPETLPEGYAYPEEQIGKFREIAHKAGLTPKQFQTILSAYQGQDMEFYQGIVKGRAEREAAVTAALQKEWGKDYEIELNLSRKAAQSFIKNDEEWQAMALALNNDERLVGLWNRIGKAMSEDTLKGGGLGVSGAKTLKEQGDAKMAEAFSLPKNDPNYQKTLAEATELYRLASQAEK